MIPIIPVEINNFLVYLVIIIIIIIFISQV